MIKEKLPFWGTLSGAIGNIFSYLPFRPNTYTWLTVIVAGIGLVAIILHHVGLGLALFIVAGVLDIIDGGLARHLGLASPAGAFLDGSLDRFVDFAVIFSYFWLPIQAPWLSLGEWVAIAVFVAIIPSFEVAYANHRKAVDDPNEVKIWRILNRGEMYPLMLAVILASKYSPVVAGWFLVVWVVLALITTFQTLYIALKLAKA
ncbi:MAG: CDP-alcohol phosphatidyltransferase family protein [Gammaproteobacteria bacterium]|nr:CDP-alcohol phosphatidyltransferase family protein [Gammaproteobacteria bacterium]